MSIDFSKASFKDFENIPGLNAQERADVHYDFLQYMKAGGHMNYRILTTSGCGPTVELVFNEGEKPKTYVGMVFNDYLGFTQHPKVKQATIDAVEKYGSGAGASPLIGGYYQYHFDLENKVCSFFDREPGSVLTYNTGYTTNSSSLQSLLQKEDIAIVDMAVHASVYEGIHLTNTKRFLHNNLDDLERILKQAKDQYRTKMVIIDGVYSQDGDIAHLPEIYELTKKYGAMLLIDDAHGIGVIGKSGRGALELYDMLDKHDIILTGTFSKALGNIGGYILANPKLISFLQFQSRQNAFSSTSAPTIAGALRAMELLDEEPVWMEKLWNNINYFKKGLTDLGMDVGTTASAVIPVKIGDPHTTGDAGRLLLEAGVYTNPILYPAVAKKDARIRMSIMATHEKEHLDKALNAFEYVDKKLHIAKTKN